jgi:hypothetical protein
MLGIGVAVAAVAPAIVQAEPKQAQVMENLWDAFNADPIVNPRGYRIPLQPKGLQYLVQNSGTYQDLHRAEL